MYRGNGDGLCFAKTAQQITNIKLLKNNCHYFTISMYFQAKKYFEYICVVLSFVGQETFNIGMVIWRIADYSEMIVDYVLNRGQANFDCYFYEFNLLK